MTTLLRYCLVAIGWLPLPVLHGAGAALGGLLWLLPTRQKRITLRHVQLAFPDLDAAARRHIARTSFLESGKAIAEAPAIWFGPAFRLRRWLRDDQAQRALLGYMRNGAAIALCPHLGSWELAGMFCAAHAGITSLYKPQKGAIDALILQGRQRLGARLVPTEGGGVRALLQALKDRQLIGILPDHDPQEGSGEFAPLFGAIAHSPSLVTKLAARTGAPVFFCLAERRTWGRGFRFHIVAAPADIGESVEALNRGVEQVVRLMPQQYWWSYPRYRRRPPGAAPFYS
ncbi:MAG TPA: lysophospholipid acyltransferase family protein [Nevskiaceae bacterium]|nr:lysophospholipid acyltransferase family protein [Nevskiaceae bacterium]